MSPPKSPWKTMGAINITPDSFSDGGQFNTPVSFRQRLNHLVSSGTDYIDIGGQSTAPSSTSISAEEEMDRFKTILFPCAGELENLALSIDTYRPQTFLLLAKELGRQLIWNDVSGVVDGETIAILKDSSPRAYILTHNFVPSKEDTPRHNSYLRPQLALEEMVSYFRDNIEKLKGTLRAEQIWLDPGFGFAKTAKQNWSLVKKMPSLMDEFRDYNFVLGISRKRFLREVIKENSMEGSEYLQALIYRDWMKSLLAKEIIVRTHTPAMVKICRQYCNLA